MSTHAHLPNNALLLLHGYAGTPFEINHIAAHLRQLNIHIDCPTLPGHADNFKGFERTAFSDWLQFTQQRVKILANQYEKVFVGGFSLGGSLALALAAEMPLNGIFSIAAPCRLYRFFPPEFKDWRLPLLGLLKFFLSDLPAKSRSTAAQQIAPSEGYQGPFALTQLDSMQKGLKKIRSQLVRIHCPILLIHDLHDRTIFPSNALFIAQSVSSKDITLHYTNIQERLSSRHRIVTHKETKEIVADLCTQFIRRLTN